MVCYTYWKQQINISVGDPKISLLYIELIKPQTIAISFESSMFHDDWQGVIEFRFKTEKVQDFHDALTAICVQQGTAENVDKPRR